MTHILEPDDPGFYPCQTSGHQWSGLIYHRGDVLGGFEVCMACPATRVHDEPVMNAVNRVSGEVERLP